MSHNLTIKVIKPKKDTWYSIEIKGRAKQALIFNGPGIGRSLKVKRYGLGFDGVYTENFAFNSMLKASNTTVRELTDDEQQRLAYKFLTDKL